MRADSVWHGLQGRRMQATPAAPGCIRNVIFIAIGLFF
jgi:hypothetical protein